MLRSEAVDINDPDAGTSMFGPCRNRNGKGPVRWHPFRTVQDWRPYTNHCEKGMGSLCRWLSLQGAILSHKAELSDNPSQSMILKGTNCAANRKNASGAEKICMKSVINLHSRTIRNQDVRSVPGRLLLHAVIGGEVLILASKRLFTRLDFESDKGLDSARSENSTF